MVNWKQKKAIKLWVLKLADSKFDPASTFSRLDIISDRETCEKKVKYRNTDEAIVALMRMEKRKGQQILQMPYRCKFCKGFHNTHLISRELLGKLVERYTKPKPRSLTASKPNRTKESR